MMCSRVVKLSKSTSCWGQTPSTFRAPPRSSLTLCPYTAAAPLVGGNKPVSRLIVVVLPWWEAPHPRTHTHTETKTPSMHV